MVEDNAQSCYLTTFLLERNGYQVACLSDGSNAVAIALRLRPRGILIDIRLPGEDGYAVVRSLRAEPRLSRVPIIAVTACAMAGDREEALAAGCNAYLAKPIDPDTFAAEIDFHLAAGRPKP